jgi:hypothetical protein
VVFADRCTPATDETLKRPESAVDRAMVPPIWKIEVANAFAKAVTRRKVSLERAEEIWQELAQLPISETSTAHDVPSLLELAVQHNISVYEACISRTPARRVCRSPLTIMVSKKRPSRTALS